MNAGGDAVTAILSNSIDATFVGPNPTVNAFAQSHGQAIRVIAGATSGGALLVVTPSIKSVADLKGKKIADPQLGATQDVALRWYLKSQGLNADASGGGDVNVLPQDNASVPVAEVKAKATQDRFASSAVEGEAPPPGDRRRPMSARPETYADRRFGRTAYKRPGPCRPSTPGI